MDWHIRETTFKTEKLTQLSYAKTRGPGENEYEIPTKEF